MIMTFTIFAGTILALSWILYFTPYMIALGRGHRSTLAISMVNLFFGWFIVGWIGALIWSLSNPSNNQPQIIINTGDNSSIVPSVSQPKPQGGRILFLMALLAILGYLSAYSIDTVFTGARQVFESELDKSQAAAQVAVKQPVAEQDSQATPDQQENQAQLAEPADPASSTNN
jgi:hypothetical protein